MTRRENKWEAALDGTRQAALRGITVSAGSVVRRTEEHEPSAPWLRLDRYLLNDADGGSRRNLLVSSEL